MDRYEVHSEIASGGMAEVYLGRTRGEAGFSRTVAIKRLYPQFAKDPAFVAMLIDEARLAARIHHPNVVAVLDVFSEGGDLSLVLEYVVGESVAALLIAARSRHETIPAAIAVSFISGVLAGLHAAHEARSEKDEPLDIVHRDVSPQNVLIGVDGVARLLDFGIAKARVRIQSTRDGTLKGKLRYLAPEQLEDGTATRRSDIYATGIVLWEALTGGRPFEGENEGAVVAKILEGMLPPPSQVVASIPAAIDAIVAQATAKDPAARFQTAQDMQIALERALRPATPREVGAWVADVAKDALLQRAKLVRAIERGHAPVARAARIPGSTTETFVRPALGATTSTSLTKEASARDASQKTKSSVPVWAAFVAIALGLSAFGAWKTQRPGSQFSSSPPEPVPAAPSLTVPKVDELPAPTLQPPGVPSSATTSGGEHSTSSSVPNMRAKTPPIASPAVSTKRASCDPPYWEDANGIRRVKRECL